MLILVLLLTVLLTESSKKIKVDEESASLLGHDKGESSDTHTSNGKSAYGSITVSAEVDGAESECDDEGLTEHEKKKAMLKKRLQAEGNWFT